jgi:tripartite-type tricarboxylate transporter receptor subunit TctC
MILRFFLSLGMFNVFLIDASSATARIENYPDKPIRWIVPFPAGGPSDVLARVVGQKLSEQWAQQVVIDNRVGAGGNIGSELAAKSLPDGYTYLMGYVGPITINMSLFRKMPYDSEKDFSPVTLIANSTLMLATNPSSGIKSVQELLSKAKQSQLSVTYGSSGNGTPAHLAGELVNLLGGIHMTHVPYKGAVPIVNELLGGQITLGIAALPAVIPHVKAKKLIPIGVSSAQRSVFAPDVPTVAEAGLTGYEVGNWQGLLLPSKVPKNIISTIHKSVTSILESKETKDRLHSMGFEAMTNTPEQFLSYIKNDIKKWSKLIKESNINLE